MMQTPELAVRALNLLREKRPEEYEKLETHEARVKWGTEMAKRCQREAVRREKAMLKKSTNPNDHWAIMLSAQKTAIRDVLDPDA